MQIACSYRNSLLLNFLFSFPYSLLYNYSLYLIQNVVKLLGISCGISGGAGSPDWKKCDVIAKLIANCPSQAESVEEYYKLVSPQVSGVLIIYFPQAYFQHYFLVE